MRKVKGWQGIGPEAGKFVPVEDGFDHVARECGITMHDVAAPLADEFKGMLVEWYFSGNWVKVSEDDCDG